MFLEILNASPAWDSTPELMSVFHRLRRMLREECGARNLWVRRRFNWSEAGSEKPARLYNAASCFFAQTKTYWNKMLLARWRENRFYFLFFSLLFFFRRQWHYLKLWPHDSRGGLLCVWRSRISEKDRKRANPGGSSPRLLRLGRVKSRISTRAVFSLLFLKEIAFGMFTQAPKVNVERSKTGKCVTWSDSSNAATFSPAPPSYRPQSGNLL